MSIFEIMAAPFAECMVLVAIHTYLGIHVLKRRVIFVDLALAQTAALGTTVGFLFGIMPQTTASLVFSIGFSSIGAAIFALTRMKNDIIPQEAIIGLFYAICAALAILVIQKTSGAEHISDILVGNILWARWADVGIAAVAYIIVGAVHFIFRKPFLLISESPQKAYAQGINVKAWDFVFYLTFGFVISFSVRIAGVLLVFVFLVAPAIIAFLLTNKLKYQLLIGWATGTVVTILGLAISYFGDLPSGPTVIVFYGVVLVIQGVVLYVVKSPMKLFAIRNVAIGVSVSLVLLGGIYLLGTQLADSELSKDEKHKTALKQVEEDTRKSADLLKKSEMQTIGRFEEWITNNVSAQTLLSFVRCVDALKKIEFITHLPKKSIEQTTLIIHFLSDAETPAFFRNEALELLHKQNLQTYGYDADKASNQTAIEKMKRNLFKPESTK